MTNFTDIRDFLRAHCARYPELALQDVFKALYQSAFGCEHLIADPSAAADYIRAEAARSGDRISELVELLGGDYCRVHLGILQDGLSAETFARLFALSARHEECGREKLEAMLTALQTMADAGELPFSAQETAEAVERWRKDGFPPLHHSEIFRQNYAPAYRVLRRDFARALPLLARIDRLTAERSRVLVAIEGGSASGKTTLGELLQNVYGCPVFHMDDFFLRARAAHGGALHAAGGNVDRERFLEEVLIPLREGRPVDYRRFDCATFTIAPPQRIKAGTLNIVEGAYSMHPDLAPYYDLSGFFWPISAEKQRERSLKRECARACKAVFRPLDPFRAALFRRARCAEPLRSHPFGGRLNERAARRDAEHIFDRNRHKNDQQRNDEAVKHRLCARLAQRREVRIEADGGERRDHQELADTLERRSEARGNDADAAQNGHCKETEDEPREHRLHIDLDAMVGRFARRPFS